MARFSEIIVTYFVLASVMWGAGFIGWADAGPAEHFIDDPTDDSGDGGITTTLENMGGPIGNIVGTLGGGLLAAWQFMQTMIGLAFWPYTVLHNTGAPPEVAVPLGGGTTAAFVGAFIRSVRGSA